MGILKTRYAEGYNLTCIATEDLTGGQLVKVVAGGHHGKAAIAKTSAAGDVAYGAVEQDAKAGEEVSVATRGMQWLTASAAIVAGAAVGPTANGRAVTAGAGAAIYGTAVQAAAAAGDLVPVLVEKR